MGVGTQLASLGLQARGLLLWTLYKLVQATVAASFSAIIVIQAGIRGLVRWTTGEPPELLKVQAARQQRALLVGRSQPAAAATNGHGSGAGHEAKAAKGPQKIQLRAVSGSASSIKPMHVFNEPEKGHDSEAWRLVGPYMRAYGRHAIANSQLFNPEYIHFFVPGVGSLPYIIADIYNCVVVSAIGDPLAPEASWRHITDLFLAEFPRAYFYHASAKYAALLQDMGYWINDVGAETTLQVQSWAYNGRTRTVRAAARAAREAGVRVRELAPHELTPEMRAMLQHEVSSDWLAQKAVADRELRVFVRAVDYEHMEVRDGVRIFVAEAYADPAAAPPAVVDAALQGAGALNAKPPKPPRASRAGLKGQASGLSRSNSVLTSAGSLASLASISKSPSVVTLSSSSCSTQQSPSGSRPDSPGSASGAEAAAAVAAATAEAAAGAAASAANATPFASTSAAQAAVASQADAQQPRQQQQAQQQQEQSQQQSQQEQPARQLIGFVLLDPLWEDGQAVGYVSSIVRMRRSAHQGTLKLLYEDIISRLRAEGRSELAFGFAPFFNVRDHVFERFIPWMRWTALYLFHCANNVYAFQNLAFSKIRYGAGLTEKKDGFRDPAVKMSHIYMANKHYMPGMSIVDLYVICMYVGFMDTVVDTWLKLTGIRKGGANLAGGGGQPGGSDGSSGSDSGSSATTRLGGVELPRAPSAVPL